MGAEPADQAVRDLISRTGLQQSLFVEAGAGTGKTTQLVERIASLVLHDGVRLANIAAITFTEAAASELQTRVRVRFEREAEATSDPEVTALCAQALADADLAAISTLHGFASRLLGEFAIEAGLPPRVSVLDEVSSQLADEDRWERFVDRLYADPYRAVLLRQAAVLDIAIEARYSGQPTMKEAAAKLNQNWDLLEPIAAAELTDLPPIDFSAFDAAAAAIDRLPSACTDPTDLFCVNLIENVIPETTAIRAVTDPLRKLSLIGDVIRVRKGWSKGRGGTAGNWGGDSKGAKANIDALNEAATATISAAADHILTQLLVLVSREVLAAAEARREDGGLQFHDLLVLSRVLLRTSGQARARLHERYTHLLLDEFQDTDPIQIELALLIAAGVEGPFEGTWDELQIADGRVFFVGDPKQSIYRFRRADIELFLQARDRFGPDDTVARLTTNFRTVAPVLDWVNAVFTTLMPEEISGRQPQYTALDAHRVPSPHADHRPVLLGGPHRDRKVKAGVLRELEADEVAATIADILANPDRWPVADDSSPVGWRAPRLADITVLTPARTSVPYLRTALETRDISYRLATGTLVYDTQEIRDLLLTLRAVDDPTDELALVGALRSTLFGCSDVDLFTYLRAGGTWNLRGDPPPDVPADHPVRLALQSLHALWEQRWWSTPTELLQLLLRERHVFLLAGSNPRPDEAWKRLRFLLDQARSFDQAGGGSLRDFLNWTDLQGADAARVHEPLLPETDDDAVRIMTIHGAKGLEFAIAIVTGMTTKPGVAVRGVQLLQDGTSFQLGIRSNLHTAGFQPRAELESAMDLHERMRLLYVALTRARDHLVVSAHHREGWDSYGRIIWDTAAADPDLWRQIDLAPSAPEPMQLELVPPSQTIDPTAARHERDDWITRRETLLASQREPQVWSATAVARADRVVAEPDDIEVQLGPDDDSVDDAFDEPAADRDQGGVEVPRRRGRAGTAVGRAVHATLQVVPLEGGLDLASLERIIARNCDDEAIPDLAPTVTALVRSALDAPTLHLASVHRSYREIYVTAPVGIRTIEGYVDLLIETPDGLVVVDYKTDAAPTEADVDAKLDAYALQGASYVLALRESTGLDVTECRFVFCRSKGPAIERTITGEALVQATARASELLGA